MQARDQAAGQRLKVCWNNKKGIKAMSRFWFILVIFSFLSFIAPAEAKTEKTSWVVNTDLDWDDQVALLYLLRQPQIQIKAISIEKREAITCQSAITLAQYLLKLSHQEKIPLACGLSGQKNAVQLLTQTLQNDIGPVNILSLGPLTNISSTFDHRPELKKKVSHLVMMGGAIRVSGNIQEIIQNSPNRKAEWNLYLDPQAAETVFKSGLSLTLVPLDVSSQAVVDRDFYQRLQDKQRTAAASYVLKLLPKSSYPLWDPLAAAIALNPKLASFKIMPLSVKLDPESMRGAIVIDTAQGNLIRVCQKVQIKQFKKQLIDGLNSKGSE